MGNKGKGWRNRKVVRSNRERERERRAWSGKKGWKKAVEEIEEEEEDRASECNWLELALSCQSSSFSARSLSARI